MMIRGMLRFYTEPFFVLETMYQVDFKHVYGIIYVQKATEEL